MTAFAGGHGPIASGLGGAYSGFHPDYSNPAAGFTSVSVQQPGPEPGPRRDSMLAPTANALAPVHAGGPHMAGQGALDSILFLIGVVFAAALIWAISRPGRTSA